jgi:peroxiredoxin
MRLKLLRALPLLGLLAAAPAGAGQAVGKPAAEFTLSELGNGGAIKLSALRGKIVVVDFWATWCQPCTRELPELEKLQRTFAAQGVVFVGVSIDKERSNAQELAARLKLTFKVLHDPEGKVAELYDPPKMPSSYVIDREGVVRYINEGFSGAADVARLRQQLDQLSRALPPPG